LLQDKYPLFEICKKLLWSCVSSSETENTTYRKERGNKMIDLAEECNNGKDYKEKLIGLILIIPVGLLIIGLPYVGAFLIKTASTMSGAEQNAFSNVIIPTDAYVIPLFVGGLMIFSASVGAIAIFINHVKKVSNESVQTHLGEPK
jgi:hypothetical protein